MWNNYINYTSMDSESYWNNFNAVGY